MAGAIHFEFDRDKAEQVILWLLNRHGDRMNYTGLLKLMYLADCRHLKEYGRPIIGGAYCAMKQGPVQSQVYNDICALREGTSTTFVSGFIVDGYDLVAQRRVTEDHLSESDREVLAAIDKEYGQMDEWQLVDETHKCLAWKKNDPAGTRRKSAPIPYEDIIDDCCDPDMIAIIRDDQEAREALKGGEHQA